MKEVVKIAVPSILSAFLFSCTTSDNKQPTVPKLDTVRYSGEWHEIARLPNSFEKNLTAAKATYEANSGGKISVRNDGLKEDGTRTSITGTARQPDPATPGKLLVRFDKFPANLFEGDYWILDVDPTYTRALVGSPGMDYLWLLSKDPSDSKRNFALQIRKARQLGYDTGKLYFNPNRITD